MLRILQWSTIKSSRFRINKYLPICIVLSKLHFFHFSILNCCWISHCCSHESSLSTVYTQRRLLEAECLCQLIPMTKTLLAFHFHSLRHLLSNLHCSKNQGLTFQRVGVSGAILWPFSKYTYLLCYPFSKLTKFRMVLKRI